MAGDWTVSRMADIKCQNCGSTDGYYKIVRLHGTGVYFYTADRKADDENGQLHDNLHYKEMKTAYCRNCGAKINLRKT